MKAKDVKCFHCKGSAYVEDKGIIYARQEVDGKWKNVPCCYPCWQEKYRGVSKDKMVNKGMPFDPIELLKMIRDTPDEKKFEMLMKNLPPNLIDIKMMSKMVYSIVKKMNAQNPELVCPEFNKLNDLANEGDITDPKIRKHRRACMVHPFTCEHEHCQSLSKFLTDTGMDKICHPDYGSMNKRISEEEEESMEDLK